MKTAKLAFLLVAVTVTFATFAAEPPVAATAAPANALVNPRAPLYELVPQISVINPSSFALTTDRYVTRYSENLYGLPALFIGVSSRIGYTGRFEYFVEGRVGYATKGGAVPVAARGANGEELAANPNETVRLHWLPIAVSARALYSIPGFPFARPSLAIGTGANFIFQRGSLPDFNSTFVVPSFTITPGLTFLDGNRGQDWFGGFTFGFSFMTTFASSQTLSGTAVDLSVNILL